MKIRHILAGVGVAAVGVLGYLGSQVPHPLPAPRPASSCQIHDGLSDPTCTPGVVRTTDLNVICKQTTGQFRPPSSYTDKLKIQQIKEYGYTDTNPADYEEDHLISLELGGDGYAPGNLWPEPHTGLNNSFDKDKIENLLHQRICDGTVTPQEAQKEIVDWTAVR